MDAIVRVLLEKLARDQGFDRLAQEQDGWLVVGSSQFAEDVMFRPGEDGKFVVATLDRSRSHQLDAIAGVTAGAGVATAGAQGDPRQSWIVTGEDVLARLLASIAIDARMRREQPLARYAEETKTLPRTTEAERLVFTRVGQRIFRDALIEFWDGKCAVTGLSVVPLLRASHAKPWAKCETDAERLDVYNGFLLAPQWDAAFDGGWITFDGAGKVVVSPEIDPDSLSRLGIDTALRPCRIDPEHQLYLAYHRAHVFLGATRG
jgi:hypothetical protein